MSHQFSVIGGRGFIGTALCKHLRSRGHDVQVIGRDDWPPRGAHLGHVIYCVGMTANFRGRPIETGRRHVCSLLDALEYGHQSFLYLSSTRVYSGAQVSAEDAPIAVLSSDPNRVYDVTKLAGESVCLAIDSPAIRVARLSNVIGPGKSANFLDMVLSEAKESGRVTFHTSEDSDKDYVWLGDVVAVLERIALEGRYRIYNLASGNNTSNVEIARRLDQVWGTRVSFAPRAVKVTYPLIDISRLKAEFGFSPATFEQSFNQLIHHISREEK